MRTSTRNRSYGSKQIGSHRAEEDNNWTEIQYFDFWSWVVFHTYSLMIHSGPVLTIMIDWNHTIRTESLPYSVAKTKPIFQSRQQWPIPLKLMRATVNMPATLLIKKWIGIHCTNSLHLTNPLLGTAREVFWEKNSSALLREQDFQMFWVSIQECPYCPFSSSKEMI